MPEINGDSHPSSVVALVLQPKEVPLPVMNTIPLDGDMHNNELGTGEVLQPSGEEQPLRSIASLDADFSITGDKRSSETVKETTTKEEGATHEEASPPLGSSPCLSPSFSPSASMGPCSAGLETRLATLSSEPHHPSSGPDDQHSSTSTSPREMHHHNTCLACGEVYEFTQELSACRKMECLRAFCKRCLSSAAELGVALLNQENGLCSICDYQSVKRLELNPAEWHWTFNDQTDLDFTRSLRDSLPNIPGLFLEIHGTRQACWRRRIGGMRKHYSFKQHGGFFEGRLQALNITNMLPSGVLMGQYNQSSRHSRLSPSTTTHPTMSPGQSWNSTPSMFLGRAVVSSSPPSSSAPTGPSGSPTAAGSYSFLPHHLPPHPFLDSSSPSSSALTPPPPSMMRMMVGEGGRLPQLGGKREDSVQQPLQQQRKKRKHSSSGPVTALTSHKRRPTSGVPSSVPMLWHPNFHYIQGVTDFVEMKMNAGSNKQVFQQLPSPSFLFTKSESDPIHGAFSVTGRGSPTSSSSDSLGWDAGLHHGTTVTSQTPVYTPTPAVESDEPRCAICCEFVTRRNGHVCTCQIQACARVICLQCIRDGAGQKIPHFNPLSGCCAICNYQADLCCRGRAARQPEFWHVDFSPQLDFQFLKDYTEGLPPNRSVWFNAMSIAWHTDKEAFLVSLCGGLFEARWMAIQSLYMPTTNATITTNTTNTTTSSSSSSLSSTDATGGQEERQATDILKTEPVYSSVLETRTG